MFEEQNQDTQPTAAFPIFNNWSVLAKGWYVVCPSADLKPGDVRSFEVCGHRVAIFRGLDGRAKALDSFCPHMGTDLGIGKVVGNHVRCFFHHWKFDGEGNCVDIPCQKQIPAKAKIASYEVQEKFGQIWLYPEERAPMPLADFEGAQGDMMARLGESYSRLCHHHIAMVNGCDAQHLRTVHGLEVDMDVSVDDQKPLQIDIVLSGKFPRGTWMQRFFHFLIGGDYSYAMRYDHASVGLLTLMRNVKLFGRFELPRLHMIFAYRPQSDRRAFVQPIFVTPKRPGPLGWLVGRFLIWLTQRAYFFLRDEDGEVYNNIRFYPNAMLAIDQPVARYIQYVNRLPKSAWSGSGLNSEQPSH